MAGFSGAAVIAAAFSEGLGFVPTHPARVAAAEADAPAMIVRRVKKDM
ncbi:MAG: hypothetical protein WA231_00725 [Methylocella sp.]